MTANEFRAAFEALPESAKQKIHNLTTVKILEYEDIQQAATAIFTPEETAALDTAYGTGKWINYFLGRGFTPAA